MKLATPSLTFFKKKIYLKGRATEWVGWGRETDRQIFHLLVYFLNVTVPALGLTKAKNLIQSLVWVWNPNMGYLLLFSRHIRGELDEKVKQLQLVLAPM